MNCTRCDGTGFLNLHQIPDSELYYLDSPEAIAEWMERNQDNDVQVCDCCGNGESHYGTPGEHDSRDYGQSGPYAYNGGLPECY